MSIEALNSGYGSIVSLERLKAMFKLELNEDSLLRGKVV